jgi:hypothetical protein
MDNKIILRMSDRPNKKLYATINGKKIYFGGIKPDGVPYSDFTEHKDPDRKERYILRHEKNEKRFWNRDGITTPSFWSRFILWNQPTLQKSIDDTNKRFNLNIQFSRH